MRKFINMLFPLLTVALLLTGCPEKQHSEEPIINEDYATSLPIKIGEVYIVDPEEGTATPVQIEKTSLFSNNYQFKTPGGKEDFDFAVAELSGVYYLLQMKNAKGDFSYIVVKIQDGVLYISGDQFHDEEYLRERGVVFYKKKFKDNEVEMIRVLHRKKIIRAFADMMERSNPKWGPFIYDRNAMKENFPDLKLSN